MTDEDYFNEEPVMMEIDGVLDLHHFSPKDLKSLIPDYLEECFNKGIIEIRIIHGKGKGNLRRSVHALLDRNELVSSYKLADQQSGSWGATLVWLNERK
ncbi:MAG: Smr/MutS family protein [Desulforhopalus sp.]